MSGVTYAFGIAAAVLVLLAIIELLRKGTLRERHAGWWFVGGLLAVVIAVFPQTLTWLSRALGIAVPINLVFFVSIGLLFLVSLQYGAELTRIESRIRDLGEQSAFLTERIRVLERQKTTDSGTTGVESSSSEEDKRRSTEDGPE